MAAAKSTARASAHPDTRPVEISLINRPTENPREDFDEDKLQSLAQSIADVGLLEPIILRPQGKTFELVAGERRFRAVEILGWSEIPATIRKLSKKEAAEIRLIENLERQSLNALEEATAFRQLEDMGHSLESLERLIRLPRGTIENRLRFLELPEWWQARIRRGELSPAAAEYLLPWRDCPEILEEVKSAAKSWPMMLTDWNLKVCEAVMLFSRSMEPDDPDGPRFKPTREDKRNLDIRPLRMDSRRTVKRAMNCYVWDELQDLADREQAPAVVSRPQRAEWDSPFNPADPSDEPTSGNRPAEAVDPTRSLGAWYPGWLRRLLTRHLSAMPVQELRALLRQLGIDPAAEWKLERGFLELHDADGLENLAQELEVDISAARNRQEIISVFLHANPDQVPQAVEAMM